MPSINLSEMKLDAQVEKLVAMNSIVMRNINENEYEVIKSGIILIKQ